MKLGSGGQKKVRGSRRLIDILAALGCISGRVKRVVRFALA